MKPSPISFDAYLAWEIEQPERHEFLRGEVFAMTGARATHNTSAGNIFAALRESLRGSSCRVFIADMKVHAATANAACMPTCSCAMQARGRRGGST